MEVEQSEIRDSTEAVKAVVRLKEYGEMKVETDSWNYKERITLTLC